MTKVKIACITIGQSPRVDIQDDISKIFGPDIELLEFGALDDYNSEQLSELEQRTKNNKMLAQGPLLVSRLRDGSQITLWENDILPHLENCIKQAEDQGCSCSILFCTGNFPGLKHTKPLFIPRAIIFPLIKKIIGPGRLGILMPDAKQIAGMREDFAGNFFGMDPRQIAFRVASPYHELEHVISEAEQLCQSFKPNAIYLDCMGYSLQIKRTIVKKCGVPVILPRTLIASIVNDAFSL